LNDQLLDLGDERTPRGQPCFGTALSSGDNSALGLAFFLAKLRRDTTLGGKAVVFDDPLSSLDLFRQSFTSRRSVALLRGPSR
jgi:wobble nucleotide-excising tRNase